MLKILSEEMAKPLSDGGLNDENQIIGVFCFSIMKEMSFKSVQK